MILKRVVLSMAVAAMYHWTFTIFESLNTYIIFILVLRNMTDIFMGTNQCLYLRQRLSLVRFP